MSSRSSSATSSGLLPRQRASARATASALHPQGACVITASYSERENLDKTLPNPLTKGAESNILLSLCGHGGTGRRVRLRGVWLTPSEFKSRWPHQKRTPGKTGGFSFSGKRSGRIRSPGHVPPTSVRTAPWIAGTHTRFADAYARDAKCRTECRTAAVCGALRNSGQT